MLYTPRLTLIPSTLEQLDAIVANDWHQLSVLLNGFAVAERWYHFPDAFVWMRNYLHQHPEEMVWWNFLILLRQPPTLIGSCGYKGRPSPDGELEIGYEIADGLHNQGFATEAAQALVQHAFSYPEVQIVIAHTLARPNASCTVLQKLGFQQVVEIFDPEEGAIWRWEKKRQ